MVPLLVGMGMRRLSLNPQAVPVILIVMTIVFFMIHLIPGNPAYVFLGAHASAAVGTISAPAAT